MLSLVYDLESQIDQLQLAVAVTYSSYWGYEAQLVRDSASEIRNEMTIPHPWGGKTSGPIWTSIERTIERSRSERPALRSAARVRLVARDCIPVPPSR